MTLSFGLLSNLRSDGDGKAQALQRPLRVEHRIAAHVRQTQRAVFRC